MQVGTGSTKAVCQLPPSPPDTRRKENIRLGALCIDFLRGGNLIPLHATKTTTKKNKIPKPSDSFLCSLQTTFPAAINQIPLSPPWPEAGGTRAPFPQALAEVFPSVSFAKQYSSIIFGGILLNHPVCEDSFVEGGWNCCGESLGSPKSCCCMT